MAPSMVAALTRRAIRGAGAGMSHQRAGISSTRVVSKRLGGNSAFVDKSSSFRKKSKRKNGVALSSSLKTKLKLKADTAPAMTHVESMRALKSRQAENTRNEALWNQLERDESFNSELDDVFAYLKNLGPNGEHIYEPDATLQDVDEKDVLAKLNALASGDPGVHAEVNARLAHVKQQHALLGDVTPADEEDTDADKKEADAEAEAGALQHELSVEDYNFLMRVYAEKGLHAEADALLTRMEKNLTSPLLASIATPATPLTSPSSSLTTESSLDAIPHTTAPDDKTYMYYIISLVNSGSHAPAAAVRALGRMKSRGVLPDVHTYNSVMNVCAKAGRVPWAYNMLEKMQLAGITPDAASFTILMSAAIAQGELDKAFETFHLMRSRVTDPDAVAFTVLIHGFAKRGRVERAINLYEDLLECGLTPTHVTFNMLILACAKSHYFAHKALEFYHEMQELYDYYPDLFTYNNVLHACAKQGDYVSAERILAQMRRHQVPIEERTYNTMLNVYARAQIRRVVVQAPRNAAPVGKNEEIYQEPLEYDEDGREIDLTRPFKEVSSMKNWNYDGTFDDDDEDEDDDENEEEAGQGQGNVDGEDEDEGDASLSADEMAELERLRAEDSSSLVAMKASDELEDVSDEDELAPQPMDLLDFGTFQNRVIMRAERMFAEMTEEQGLPPSVVTLTSMLSVYANALRLQRAEKFFEDAFAQYGVARNTFTYRTMMQMYVRGKRTDKAENLLSEIEAHLDAQDMAMDGQAGGEDDALTPDLQADAITMGLLVDHHARHKRLRRALSLLEQVDARQIVLPEKYLKKVRQLSERLGIFSELIPEDPHAVITAGSRAKLMEKRKVRAQVIAYNQRVGKKYLLPASVRE